MDIGGTTSKYGIVDDSGKILEQGRVETCCSDDPRDFVKRVSEVLRPLIEKFGGTQSFRGLGIGAPNGNFYTGSIDRAPNLKWKGVVPLKAMFEESLGLPVVVTNDANAAAMGEMIYGGAKGMKDFIIVTLGTGLGSGFVADGKLIYGSTGMAGELGHIIIEKNGRQCGCGRKGCLETYASATGLVLTAKESGIKVEGEMTSAKVAALANSGDQVAQKVFQTTAEILGLALANAVTFSSPEAIFLFGGVAQSGELLFGPTRKTFEENIHNIYRDTVRILPSSLSDSDAAILGSAALVS